ncbi:MAG: histidine kinase, partial [Eubacteriales bacterium]|nr:histidine kinase [Eubacteriales bacterium]
MALLLLDVAGLLNACLWCYVHGTLPMTLFLVCSAGLVLCALAGVFWVYRPYRKTTHLLELFAGGYTLQGLNQLQHPYNGTVERMIRRLMDYMRAPESINATRRQTQYLALQNQINPHFLYNTLECIRSEALSAEVGSVADMCEALATFFRYTISNLDTIATIEEELNNVKNYFFIQQYRFGQRIKMSVEYEPEDEAQILRHPIPRLTLQPITENAILHGVEKTIGESLIQIRIVLTEERLVLTVSDNGVGIEPEELEKLNH